MVELQRRGQGEPCRMPRRCPPTRREQSRCSRPNVSPVIVRAISIRWISDVHSKMVKILPVGTVPQFSGLQTPVISARIQHARSEMNVGFGLARARFL